MKIPQDSLIVAKIGRAFGVRGELLLHLVSDFPETICSNSKYFSNVGDLIIESFDVNRSIVKFRGIDSREDARNLTNLYLYSTKETTIDICHLQENEYFWFDIVNSVVYENGEYLGHVSDIERLGDGDYLVVATSKELLSIGLPKSFLIPYTDRYILNVDNTEPKRIDVKFCKDILECS